MKRFTHFLVFTLTLFIFTFTSSAQIGREYLGNGTYQYKSGYPAIDLHFYLFGDGHYSFTKSPVHQYGNLSNMKLAIAAHEPPYDDDYDVEEFSFGSLPNTSSNPSTPTYELSNKVELKKSWNLTATNDNYYILSFENAESQEPISGCLEFHFSDSHLSLQTDNIHDDYGNNWVKDRQLISSDYPELGLTTKLVWNYYDLEFGEQRIVYIKTDCLVPATTTVRALGVMKIEECGDKIPFEKDNDGSQEGIYDSGLYLDQAMVQTNPHDPNMIISLPECLQMFTEEEIIRYRFYFQNDGEDPAIDVRVEFRTSERMNGVVLLQASANCGLTNVTSNSFDVTFPEIWLPGGQGCDTSQIQTLNTPCVENIGWVELDVCYDLTQLPQENTQDGCIKSSIDIFFDSVAPVQALYDLCRDRCQDDCTFLKQGCHAIPYITPDNYSQWFQYNGKEVNEDFECPDYTNGPHQAFIVQSNSQALNANNLLGMEIYPNPAHNQLRVDFHNNNIDPVELMIRDLYGKVLMKFKMNSSGKIDISDLNIGTYTISIISGHQMETKKFIKI